MGLKGNIKTMALADLLQWLSLGKKTGTLRIHRQNIIKKVYFKHGKIISASSNDPREYIGTILLNKGQISEEVLKNALVEHKKRNEILGRYLVKEELIPEEDMTDALKTKVEETIYNLFLWPDGEFLFFDNEIPHEPLFPISVSIDWIIMEGMRRVDERKEMRKIFENDSIVLERHEDKLDGYTFEFPIYQKILDAINGQNAIEDIIEQVNSSEFEILSILYQLQADSLVSIIGEKVVVADAEKENLEKINELVEKGLRHHRNQEFDDAVDCFKEILRIDPTNMNAQLLIQTVEKEQSKSLSKNLFSPNSIPFLKKDLTELMQRDFSPEQGFILSLINGKYDIKAVKMLSQQTEDYLLDFLRKLYAENIIAFKTE